MLTLSITDPIFPKTLNNIDSPPKSLFAQGAIEVLQKPLISVVGARNICDWSMEWMENELAPCINELKMGIVSGGARGVDQWGHRLAIRQGLPTVIVLPSGLNQMYPRELQNWKEFSHVLFLSEYGVDQPMLKHHFYARNRLVVGLSPLTLVVQAKERSGTMISARFARDQGKCLATLPSHPLDSRFTGNNQLLFDGAMMVRDKGDLALLIQSCFNDRL